MSGFRSVTLTWSTLGGGSYDYWGAREGAQVEAVQTGERWEKVWIRRVFETIMGRGESTVWVRGYDYEWLAVAEPKEPSGWKWVTRRRRDRDPDAEHEVDAQ